MADRFQIVELPRAPRPTAVDVADWMNLALAGCGLIVALLLWPTRGPVTALVPDMEPGVRERIERLEAALARNPGDVRAAAELSRLWHFEGQPPWSYTALARAERDGPRDPDARLSLGAAYLDLYEPDDAVRVLREAHGACLDARDGCGPALRFKIDLLLAIAEEMVAKDIDPRRERTFAADVINRHVKEARTAVGEREPDAEGSAPDLPESSPRVAGADAALPEASAGAGPEAGAPSPPARRPGERARRRKSP